MRTLFFALLALPIALSATACGDSVLCYDEYDEEIPCAETSTPTESTAETCQTAGSTACGSCLDGNQSCSTTDNSFYSPESPRDSNGELIMSCSDGGAKLQAYTDGWTNRGCTE